MTIRLHPYQRRAVAAIHEALKEGRSTLLVLPTGCGKTIVFSSVLKDRAELGRSIVLAHREELIAQAVSKIRRVASLDCDVEMADHWADQSWQQWRSPVIVSTIQTQISGRKGEGRMTRFNPREFQTAIADEAHHYVAGSFRRTLDYWRQNPDLRLLGVTATPNRHDEAALGQVFGSVAFEYSLADAVNEGWLSPIYQTIMPIEELDISGVHTTAGDLNGAELSKQMTQQKPLLGLANGIWRESRGRKTLVFAASVEHARLLCGIFNTDYRGGSARFVSGKTPKDERRRIFMDYAAGEFQILCNCAIATEGFDDPSIEVVVPKPTKSTPLFLQMIGRATRTLPGVLDCREWDDDQTELGLEGEQECQALRRKLIAESAKPYCEVLDLHCQSGRHQLVSCVDALGGKYSDEVLDRARTFMGDEDVREKLKRAQKEIAHEAAVQLERKRIDAYAKYNKKTYNAFEAFGLTPEREAGWNKNRMPSAKMLAFLEGKGVNVEGLTFSQANQLIGEMKRRWSEGLVSMKQANVLRRAGFPTNITQEQARPIIDTLASNNWQWPLDVDRPLFNADGKRVSREEYREVEHVF